MGIDAKEKTAHNASVGADARQSIQKDSDNSIPASEAKCNGEVENLEEMYRRIRRMAPLWGIAAAAAVVLGIFVCADLLRKPYCYIDGVAVYDAEVAMPTTVYLESFSALEESGRMVDELIENT